MTFSQNLSDYQWENRLLILVSKAENPDVAEQKRVFPKTHKEFAERDLLLLERAQNDSELMERFDISATFQGVLLIGKDGGLKLKKPFFVEPEDIFKLIDGMPMRRAEMKKY